jgi:hypothetical protein
VVTRDVAAYTIVGGVPARQIASIAGLQINVADRVVGLAGRNHLAAPAGASVGRCRGLLRALGF